MALTAWHRRIVSGRKKLSEIGISPSLFAYSAFAILCIIILAGSAISRAATTASTARKNAEQIQMFAIVVDAASSISAERGPANNYMTSTPATKDMARQRWLASQQETDAALKAAVFAGVAVQTIERVRGQLSAGRKLVELAAEGTRSDRRAIDIQFAITTMFRAWDVYNADVVVQKGLEIITRDPRLSAVILQGTALSDMREYGGRIGSYLIAAMAERQQISADNLLMIRTLRGRLDESWRFLAPAVLGIGEDPAVRLKALDVQRAFFGAGVRLVDSEIAQNMESGTFSMDAATFTTRYVELLTPLSRLRNTYLNQLVETYEKGKAEATNALLRDGMITFLLLTLVIGLLFKVRNRLVRPLLAGVEDVVALADGRSVQARDTKDQIYEINKLFKAITVLKVRLEERAELTRQLEQLAETDQLTNLFNRRGFEKRALEARAGTKTQLIVLDIDHFKTVNDKHGHPVGDKVLRQVARIMTLIAGQDAIIGRLGGEEFAILCEGHSPRSAVLLARRLKTHLENHPMQINGNENLKITASFGVSVDAGIGLSERMKRADEALYRAKAEGRNRVRIARMAKLRRRSPSRTLAYSPAA